MRIRLDIAYDGSQFRGWARQPGLRTVQGELENALARIIGGDPRLVVAGRTDAGVHASGQVAHLDLDPDQVARLPRRRRDNDEADAIAALAGRVRGVLGAYADVTVSRTSRAPAGFDARFSAVWRRYSYRLADATTAYDPLDRKRTTSVRSILDVEAMDAAASRLIGLHDFAAYCKAREEATTIRTLLEYDWRRDDTGVLIANVRADAFCHSMVRALVGACVAVGEGRIGIDDVVAIREARMRIPETKVLAARGLVLAEVGYPADGLLAARAEQTRNRRDAEDPAS
ncbi:MULTISPECIES: tRNA pseudouridine(38-40) synthase TruA [Microbacterium]|uniref:tRNA pseudouridine synthase A n=1 Tax=Microbacterium testaceum TaxID=2033 RepID=A0A4Y3QFX6_MICTE|nr:MULTISPECIES: tRNA pseudouridine(38-40) synthase TruA [Microbacterium]MDZ5145784.1 tRNA pseudouridine(38-40) synthase TruA [Microbacterium testaceum]PNW09828.1 tRNA pseudouridine(38-40) synthase TruA [Microbacterium testaceum]REC99838.1 tRNA pseudouridine(38-40) synthase [Microbacterium sp. AG157]WJS91449.1 tRNA pseudouridine(38-40) synthase TruA [Microbacterium testaceum]GEB44092.1 tRNA pseudouridine synthase A [Microbacterium testaceum]